MASTDFAQITTADLTAQVAGVEAMLKATTVATETTGQFFAWLGAAVAELAKRSA
jgi:hypothetical protein